MDNKIDALSLIIQLHRIDKSCLIHIYDWIVTHKEERFIQEIICHDSVMAYKF